MSYLNRRVHLVHEGSFFALISESEVANATEKHFFINFIRFFISVINISKVSRNLTWIINYLFFRRLFVVCQPDAPPVSALKDIFCRFGNLVDIYLLPGKNYGYASYSDLDSAKKAIAVSTRFHKMKKQKLFLLFSR